MRYRPCTLQVMARLPVKEPSTCGQSCQKVSGSVYPCASPARRYGTHIRTLPSYPSCTKLCLLS